MLRALLCMFIVYGMIVYCACFIVYGVMAYFVCTVFGFIYRVHFFLRGKECGVILMYDVVFYFTI